MESTTRIGFTTAFVSRVTIVQSTWSANTIKLDDIELAVASAVEGTGCRIYTVANVAAGDHVIGRGSGESGLFYVKVEWGTGVEDGGQPFGDEWTIAGSEAILGSSWDTNDTNNNMTSEDGITYTLVKENCTLEAGTTYIYKVVKNHDWANENYGANGVLGGENVQLTVDETGVYTVTFTFVNDDSHALSAVAVKSGEAGPITHTYAIVGELTGGWENDAQMTQSADDANVYTLTIEGFEAEAKTYSYKLRADGKWGGYELPASGNNSYKFDVAGIYTLVFAANISEHTLALEATKTGDVEEPTYIYAVVGGKKVAEGEEADAAIFSGNWDAAGTTDLMTLDEESGKYVWKKEAAKLDPQTIALKVIKKVEGAEEATAWYPTDNVEIEIAEAGEYNVTVTFDPNAEDLWAQNTVTAVADKQQATNNLEIYAVQTGSTITPSEPIAATQSVTITPGNDTEWPTNMSMGSAWVNPLEFDASIYYANSTTTYTFEGSMRGTNNPKDGDIVDGVSTGNGYKPYQKNTPRSGGFLVFESQQDGSLIIPIRVFAGKPLFVTDSEGNTKTDIQFKIASGQTLSLQTSPLCAVSAEEDVTGFVSFNVTKGEKYYVFCTGSKARFGGCVFSTQTIDIDPATMVNVMDSLNVVPAVAPPTFTHDGNVVIMSCSNNSATIYYTLDGSMPSTESSVYTAPLTLTQNCVIKAIAVADGYVNSEVTTFEVDWFKVEPVEFAQEGNHVSLSTTTEQATIYYTLSNTEEDEQTYTAPLTMTGDCVIEAWATREGYNDSDTTRYEFRYIPQGDATFDGLVATVSGERTLDEAFRQVGGRAEAAKTIAAIIWNKDEALTPDDLQGIDNPNLLVYAKDRALVPYTVNNVVVGGVARNLILTDNGTGNCNFYCPLSFTAQHATYSRDFTQRTQPGVSQGWETLALPFDVQEMRHATRGAILPFGATGNGRHFWLRRQTAEGGLAQATGIEANRAYLISMPNSDSYDDSYNLAGRVTFSATDVTIPVTAEADSTGIGTRLTAAFQRIEQSPMVYAINRGEAYGGYAEGSVFVSGLREVRPFEAYTLHQDTTVPAPLYIPIDGESWLTDITPASADKQPGTGQYYDLQGRRVAQPTKKGLYIVNGQKTVVR